MKKRLPFFVLAGIVLLLPSCGKNDAESCGEESIAGFPNLTANSFQTLTTPEVTGNTTYTTAYFSGATTGNSAFAFDIELENVCAYEEAVIMPQLILFIANSDIKDTLYISSPDGNYIKQVLNPVNGVYQVNQAYPFNGTDKETTLSSRNVVYIPYQGSYSADSLYFWEQVDNVDLGVSYKKDN